MHHLYPLAKGDPLCPLGFHPQVRWPTRCKRCFRDYKEHGGARKREDDFAASTPALSTCASPASRGRDEENGGEGVKSRGWASSTNLSANEPSKKDAFSSGFSKASSAWTSTPDLGGDADSSNAVSFSLKLPKRRATGPLPSIDTGQTTKESTVVTLRRPSPSPPPTSNNTSSHLTINKNDSLAERVRKMQLLKAQNSFEKEASVEKEKEKEREKEREREREREKEREKEKERERDKKSSSRSREDAPAPKPKEEKHTRTKEEAKTTSHKEDVNFLMQVKSNRLSGTTKPPLRGGPSREESDDELSTAGTHTTTDTLVDAHVREFQEQIEGLKQEVDTLKKRCERVEKEKSDILLRRLANIDTSNKFTTGRSSEVLKLQQKVNELTTQNEDLKDEKKHLSLKIKECEVEIENRPSAESAARQLEQLRSKLLAAETLCEELMDENEDMKKELRDLEEEIEEMQDNFREDQADEYSSLRRELEQTIKNCRVLSFKLKKTERRADQLEHDKADQEKKLLELVGGEKGMDHLNRIKELEKEVARSNEVALRLQRELAEANGKLANGTATPSANSGKKPSIDGKMSRASLTRGGSQEDPAQLLRDLQDSLEREADLREQLRNAEEEANNLRKTASRVEDDNESLLLQLKKMATKARSRKLSPTPPTNRLAIEAPNEKDEGISDEEDPAELRLLLELNEQESAVLRRKVEELEQDKDSLKKQVKELSDKIATTLNKPNTISTVTLRKNANNKSNNLADEKAKVLEDEIAELRMKLIEKERDCERLHAELSLTKKKPKASLIKSKSLDGSAEQHVDLKRQLQVIEQEASVLRTKTQSLELDNDKLLAENKKLQLLKNAKTLKSDKSIELNANKISKLESELKDALAKIQEFETSKEKEDKTERKVRFGGEVTKKDLDAVKAKQEELDKMKLSYNKIEKENIKLKETLKALKEDAVKSFAPRTPKKLTDITTKLQMKKMVEDLESEIGQMYVIMKNAGLSANELNSKAQLEKDIEDIRSKLTRNESEYKNEKNKLQTEIAKLKDLNTKLETDKSKLEERVKSVESEKVRVVSENKTLKEEKKKLDAQITKLNTDIKTASTQQTAVSDLMKKIEDLKKDLETKDKEIDKLKKIAENVPKLEQDKSKLLKETGDKAKKINELEKRYKESDEKIKRTEKVLATKKERVSKLEKEEEALRETSNQKYDEAISPVEMSQMQDKLEKTLRDLEERDEKLSEAQQKIVKTEQKLAIFKNEISMLKADIAKMENEKKDLESKLQAEKKDAASWESKASEFETDLQAERKKMARMRAAHEKDVRNKELELGALRDKLQALEAGAAAAARRLADRDQDNDEARKKLEHSLAVERAEYEELTGKYEILEEEHVVTKARLTIEKEAAQSELMSVKKELNATVEELKSFQDSVETQSAIFEKEKAELQSEVSSLQERLCGGGWEVQRARLTARLEDAARDLTAARDRNNVLQHSHDAAKKELEESRKMLEDYEKVSKVQRNLATQNAELERELGAERARLEAAERARRTELADARARHDAQLAAVRAELSSHQHQVEKFRRERDNYKQMLESAQKTISDLKNGDPKRKRTSISSTDEEEYRSKVVALQQQAACLEDELCEARLRSSQLQADLASERANNDLRRADLQSRLNELEEERLMGTGRNKVAGLGTRMELAWHKERDEQQRLLHETATLARDLRHTLLEVEREREKERLDMKRRIDQLKRTTEEETEDAKKKVSELQCDLLELRDAHAKLRTANEKLRRDRERHERERDQHRLLVAALKRAQQDDDRRITQLLETIEDLMKMSPELFSNEATKAERSLLTPTPPRRNRSSKSRSRSNTPEGGAGAGGERGGGAAARLLRLTEELRASRIAERQRRQQNNARRAMSTEPRDTLNVPSSRLPSRTPSLSKRSISLEQTTKDQSAIWKSVDEGSVSSMQSLEGGAEDGRPYSLPRDNSLDSRLSGGSTQSDVLPRDKKKKKGLLGKLKRLTKSRSIDDQPDPDLPDFRPISGTASQQGSESDMSATGSAVGSVAGSKRDLRGRISDMFHRKPPSRANSKDKDATPERPASAMSTPSGRGGDLPRNTSTATLARTPANGTSSRAASATPAVKRKGK